MITRNNTIIKLNTANLDGRVGIFVSSAKQIM